ncbi:MAG: hypothetical protein ACP5KA_06835 [Desulfurococcaceae archaeon]
MPRALAFAVGFDEKLVLRSAFRVGLRPDDHAVLVYSLSGDEQSKAKTLTALETVRRVFSSAGIKLREVELQAADFGRDVGTVVKALRELTPSELVIALGSGMRYFGVVLTYAALLYRELYHAGCRLLLHVMREDGLYDVAVPLDVLELRLGPRELEALCLLKPGEEPPRDELVKRVVRSFGVSQSTAYALVERMGKRGLVSVSYGRVEPTPLARAIYHSYCEEKST